MNLFKKWGAAIATTAFLACCTAVGHSEPARSYASAATVRQTQRELKAEGYYHGRIDGIAGPQTRGALRQYQRDNALPVTGRLTASTANRLGANRPSNESQSAGNSVTGEYSHAGHAVAGGTTGMVHQMQQGNVGSGVAQFGTGVKNGAVSVGKGTAHGAEKAYRGVKKAIPH